MTDTTIHRYEASVTDYDADTGTATVRVMPWGETTRDMFGTKVTYDAGSLTVADHVPVNLDHKSQDVLSHIGRVVEYESRNDGLYARIKLSDTANARDTRTLLRDGVITDVSAGVRPDFEREYTDQQGIEHRFGVLAHVGIVAEGAFGGPERPAGSKVLTVHTAHSDSGGAHVSNETETAPSEAHNDTHDYAALEGAVDQLRAQVAELSVPGNIQARDPELNTGQTLAAVIYGANPEKFRTLVGGDSSSIGQAERNLKRIQEYALAKDNTTVGAGVVPDFAKSEVVSIVDANMPINSVLRKVPIEQYGMTLDFPIVATKPSVAVQSSQHDEPDSTQIDINTLALSLGTYAGASDVAIQLLERSMPSYLQVLYEEYAHVYATALEVVASDALIAGAGGTAVLASLSADAAATVAAVATRKAAVIAGTRQLPTHMIVGTTRWTQLESLVDTTDRPLLHFGDGQNSLGSNASPTFMGMQVVVSPDATATDCIIINARRSLLVADSGPQFFDVDIRGTSLSVQLGIYGYYGTAVAHAAGIQTLTPS